MSTVYVTNRSPTHDYSPAEKYGTVAFLTSGNYPIFRIERLQEEMIEILIHSQPSDYLLPSGGSVIVGMAMAIWLQLHKEVKLLLWDRARDEYVERRVDLSIMRLAIEETLDRINAASR